MTDDLQEALIKNIIKKISIKPRNLGFMSQYRNLYSKMIPNFHFKVKNNDDIVATFSAYFFYFVRKMQMT